MKPTLISYSFTGNNDAVATCVAARLGAEHIRLTEPRKRTLFRIGLDIIFNRMPRVQPLAATLNPQSIVLFMGPVWMGRVATPLRSYFKHFKGMPGDYVYVAISGGAEDGNPLLSAELTRRLGKPPAAVIDLHVADLMPPDIKIDAKGMMAYRLSETDVKNLTHKIVAGLEDILLKQPDGLEVLVN